eukprot:7175509-Pyramimonas_sp.AAC.1
MERSSPMSDLSTQTHRMLQPMRTRESHVAAKGPWALAQVRRPALTTATSLPQLAARAARE